MCQEDLNSFLLCAEELQIKGLSESGKRQSPSLKCKIQETNSGSSGEQVESRGKRVLDEEDRGPSDALKKKKKIAACFQPKSPSSNNSSRKNNTIVAEENASFELDIKRDPDCIEDETRTIFDGARTNNIVENDNVIFIALMVVESIISYLNFENVRP